MVDKRVRCLERLVTEGALVRPRTDVTVANVLHESGGSCREKPRGELEKFCVNLHTELYAAAKCLHVYTS